MITFEEIVKCWREKKFSDNFLDELERYLEMKEKNFMNVSIKDIPRWLSQVVLVLEIGMALDAERFEKHYEYWKKLLGREWVADLEEVWVKWKK